MLAGADLADAGYSFGFRGGFDSHLGNYSIGIRPLWFGRQFETCVDWVEFRIVRIGVVLVWLIAIEVIVALSLASRDTRLGVIVGTESHERHLAER